MQNETRASVHPTDVTIEATASRFAADASLATRLRHADLLLLPRTAIPGFEGEGEVFAAGVLELCQFLQENEPDVRVEFASAEEEPRFLILHGQLFDLGRLLVTSVALPVVLGVLSNYIWSRIASANRRDARARLEVVVQHPDGGSLEIRYDGPAETLSELVLQKTREATGRE